MVLTGGGDRRDLLPFLPDRLMPPPPPRLLLSASTKGLADGRSGGVRFGQGFFLPGDMSLVDQALSARMFFKEFVPFEPGCGTVCALPV